MRQRVGRMRGRKKRRRGRGETRTGWRRATIARARRAMMRRSTTMKSYLPRRGSCAQAVSQ